ncbi:hypothetical protein [Streptomyces niveus]|uniref:hypothetical protein n=1 Tax=Streptomyces niveus TaxID=193462 RepID=UPI0036C4544B
MAGRRATAQVTVYAGAALSRASLPLATYAATNGLYGCKLPDHTGQRLPDRHDREQRAALAALGMDWAGAVLAVGAAPAQPAPSAAPTKRPPWDHHEECDNS